MIELNPLVLLIWIWIWLNGGSYQCQLSIEDAELPLKIWWLAVVIIDMSCTRSNVIFHYSLLVEFYHIHALAWHIFHIVWHWARICWFITIAHLQWTRIRTRNAHYVAGDSIPFSRPKLIKSHRLLNEEIVLIFYRIMSAMFIINQLSTAPQSRRTIVAAFETHSKFETKNGHVLLLQCWLCTANYRVFHCSVRWVFFF